MITLLFCRRCCSIRSHFKPSAGMPILFHVAYVASIAVTLSLPVAGRSPIVIALLVVLWLAFLVLDLANIARSALSPWRCGECGEIHR